MDELEKAYTKRNLERSIRDAAPDMLLALQAIAALAQSVAASKQSILDLANPAIQKALHGKCIIDG